MAIRFRILFPTLTIPLEEHRFIIIGSAESGKILVVAHTDDGELSQMKGGVRGKYVERYREGTNLVLLDPDVAAAFPDAKAVNDALRLLLREKDSSQPL